ncbi:hypothetical protein SKAU_G00158340 [Synaphobranchus kaupii]|uniref:Uncharacterized protein n=1 Tax=Synaphobranchus kaupii TaxID=118154 RepID=A0A9Q1IXD2_SYNKA|nr:hypothetical protein SKAU_G00158340 [Synaphobranchus kaupii]
MVYGVWIAGTGQDTLHEAAFATAATGGKSPARFSLQLRNTELFTALTPAAACRPCVISRAGKGQNPIATAAGSTPGPPDIDGAGAAGASAPRALSLAPPDCHSSPLMDGLHSAWIPFKSGAFSRPGIPSPRRSRQASDG